MRRILRSLSLAVCLLAPGATWAQTLSANLTPTQRATGNFVVTRSGATVTVAPGGAVTVVGGARLSGSYGGRGTTLAAQTATIDCRGGSGSTNVSRCRNSEFRIFVEPVSGSSSGAATSQLSLDSFSFGSTTTAWSSTLPSPRVITPSSTTPALTLRTRDTTSGQTATLTFRIGVTGTLSSTTPGEARWAYRVRVQRVRLSDDG